MNIPYRSWMIAWRRTRAALVMVLGLGGILWVFGTIGPRVSQAAELPFPESATVFGQTGLFVINSTNVLAPGEVRFGVNTFFADSNTGNRFDLLAEPGDKTTKSLAVRGTLGVGLPGRIETAVSVPYVKLEDEADSIDGLGDLTAATKMKLWDQSDWRPALAVSVLWVGELARDARLRTVSTIGYGVSVPLRLGLVTASDGVWSFLAEVGGFWRDLGRDERESYLVYGLAAVTPIIETGFYAKTGELQFVLELDGTQFRRDQRGETEDVVSGVAGLRLVREHWDANIGVVYTLYQTGDKENSVGGTLGVSRSF